MCGVIQAGAASVLGGIFGRIGVRSGMWGGERGRGGPREQRSARLEGTKTEGDKNSRTKRLKSLEEKGKQQHHRLRAAQNKKLHKKSPNKGKKTQEKKVAMEISKPFLHHQILRSRPAASARGARPAPPALRGGGSVVARGPRVGGGLGALAHEGHDFLVGEDGEEVWQEMLLLLLHVLLVHRREAIDAEEELRSVARVEPVD
mmetsp:Transcript_14370/g.36733  ORF Transcript_14370/g.36733 Transcript_14370/m.36733 type:complete len:203 (-) Transcript_14370:1192-1800(-)